MIPYTVDRKSEPDAGTHHRSLSDIPASGSSHRARGGARHGSEFVSAYRRSVPCTEQYLSESRPRPKSPDAGVSRPQALTPVSVLATLASTQSSHGPSKQPLTSHQSQAPASDRPRACSPVNSNLRPASSRRSSWKSPSGLEARNRAMRPAVTRSYEGRVA